MMRNKAQTNKDFPLSNRKLVAILFSDITGYTSMMQSDESKALRMLERYKTVHEKEAKIYNGEIIQYYGDACLIIFKSAYEAVKFGETIQVAFRKEPQVPVRIGLHLGDVVFKDQNVFGDAVNVASRVESMGVPGAVLFSETIFRSIQGHPDLIYHSLGKFEFKNVDQPLHLYALANKGFPIPEEKDMKGKLKPKSGSELEPSKFKMTSFYSLENKSLKEKMIMTLSVLISFMIFLFLVWTFSKGVFEKYISSGDLEKEPMRIAVFNFENRTGDSSLHIIGEMTADRISHSISKNQIATVISNDVYDDYSSIVRMGMVPTPDKLAVHKYLSTSMMISGNYYLEGDNLLFEASITDIEDGSIIFAIDASSKSVDDALSAIKFLQESISGYLVTSDQPELILETHTPLFEAYKHHLLAKEDEENELFHLERAIEIDSNYVDPQLFRLSYYYNLSEFEIVDSLYRDLKEKLVFANERQRNLLSFYDALLKGKNDQAYNSWMREYEYAPFDMQTNLSAMVLALQFVNMPEKTLEYYLDVPSNGIDMANCSRCQVRSYVNILGLIELQKYSEAIEGIQSLLDIEYDPFYLELLVKTYAKNGKWEDIQDVLMRYTRITDDDILTIYLALAKEAIMSDSDSNKNEYLNRALKINIDSTGYLRRGEIYFYLNDYVNASTHFEKALETESDSVSILGLLAASYLMEGEIEKSDDIASQLLKMDHRYQYGSVQYALARLSLVKGDIEETQKLLKEAVSRGIRFRGVTFQNDAFFHNVQETEEFQNILNYWK